MIRFEKWHKNIIEGTKLSRVFSFSEKGFEYLSKINLNLICDSEGIFGDDYEDLYLKGIHYGFDDLSSITCDTLYNSFEEYLKEHEGDEIVHEEDIRTFMKFLKEWEGYTIFFDVKPLEDK